MERRARHVLALGLLGTLGCAGASESVRPMPREPVAQAREPVAESVPATWAPHLTDVAPERSALCPACFEVAGLPAISADGASIAVFVSLPIYFEQNGGAFDAERYVLLLVDARTGEERRRVVLLDRDDIEIDRTTLTDCCRDSPDDCDPDLCADDPELSEASDAERRARLAGRLADAHALLDATSWRALTPVPSALGETDADERGPTEVALYGADAAGNDDEPFFDTTFAPGQGCPECALLDANAWRDEPSGLTFVAVVVGDETREHADARCFVQPGRAP